MLFLSDDNTRRGAVSVQPGQVMPLYHGGRAAGGAAARAGWPMSADVAGAAGGERVADPQPHGRADRQGGEVAGREPAGVAGLHLVADRAGRP